MDNSHQQVDNNAFKVALLENNQTIFDRMDKAIDTNGAKITKSVNDKTDGFITQVASQAASIGSLQTQVSDLKAKYSGIWSKVVGIQAVASVITGFIGYLLGSGGMGH